jgi:hypothetical protein
MNVVVYLYVYTYDNAIMRMRRKECFSSVKIAYLINTNFLRDLFINVNIIR